MVVNDQPVDILFGKYINESTNTEQMKIKIHRYKNTNTQKVKRGALSQCGLQTASHGG